MAGSSRKLFRQARDHGERYSKRMAVPSQDLFGGNTGRDLDACVALVNDLAPGWSQGVPFASPGAERAAEVVAASLTIGHYDPRPRRSDVAVRAAALAADLHRTFAFLAAGEHDGGAQIIQALLERYDVRLRLSNHAARPWHIHYRADIPDATDALGAGSAAALALAIDAGAYDRLRLCAAERCDRVLFDRSRNGSRRFCSASCRNRTKTQAFRRRAALNPLRRAAAPSSSCTPTTKPNSSAATPRRHRTTTT